MGSRDELCYFSTLINKIPHGSCSFSIRRDALTGVDWQFIDSF